jgi:hypothetical protein
VTAKTRFTAQALARGAQRNLPHVQAGPERRGYSACDATIYVCECGLKFRASTCPHTACPACGHEQPW